MPLQPTVLTRASLAGACVPPGRQLLGCFFERAWVCEFESNTPLLQALALQAPPQALALQTLALQAPLQALALQALSLQALLQALTLQALAVQAIALQALHHPIG